MASKTTAPTITPAQRAEDNARRVKDRERRARNEKNRRERIRKANEVLTRAEPALPEGFTADVAQRRRASDCHDTHQEYDAAALAAWITDGVVLDAGAPALSINDSGVVSQRFNEGFKADAKKTQAKILVQLRQMAEEIANPSILNDEANRAAVREVYARAMGVPEDKIAVTVADDGCSYVVGYEGSITEYRVKVSALGLPEAKKPKAKKAARAKDPEAKEFADLAKAAPIPSATLKSRFPPWQARRFLDAVEQRRSDDDRRVVARRTDLDDAEPVEFGRVALRQFAIGGTEDAEVRAGLRQLGAGDKALWGRKLALFLTVRDRQQNEGTTA